MKNVNHYNGDAFEFYEKVVKSKNVTKDNPDYKARLAELNNEIQALFKQYDAHFVLNNLQAMNSNGYVDPRRNDLHALYLFRSKIMQELKVKLTTFANERRNNTCQNCTIGEVNSFDHLIPKEEFSEFVVNPKNLFPSCARCNGHKTSIWREKGKRIFLNLYLDRLPNEQYLFADAIISKENIEVSFFLDNPHGINIDLFGLIQSHYAKLMLFQRFAENSDTVITELENSIKAGIGKVSLEDMKALALARAEQNKLAFGTNYWKSVLEIMILNNDDFMARF